MKVIQHLHSSVTTYPVSIFHCHPSFFGLCSHPFWLLLLGLVFQKQSLLGPRVPLINLIMSEKKGKERKGSKDKKKRTRRGGHCQKSGSRAHTARRRGLLGVPLWHVNARVLPHAEAFRALTFLWRFRFSVVVGANRVPTFATLQQKLRRVAPWRSYSLG